MSSTVTTTTVSSLSLAATSEHFGATLALSALVMLMLFLLSKEVFGPAQHRFLRSLTRGSDISVIPLCVVVLMTVAINAVAWTG